MKTTSQSSRIQPGYSCRKEIRSEFVSYFEGYQFDYFFTLTFKNDVSEQVAELSLKHFRNLLSTKAFGHNKRKKPGDHPFQASFIAALECQSGGRLHWHVVMQPFHESSKISGKPSVMKAVKDCWSQCGGSTRQFDFQMINKYEESRVIGYVIKEVAFDTDSIFLNWFTKQG